MRRTISLLSAVMVLSLLAAACGSGSSSNPTGTTNTAAYRLVSATATKTQAAKSARMALTATIKAAGHSLTMTGTGEFDTADNEASLAMSIPTPKGTFSLHEIVTGSTVYMRLPAQLMQGVGKSWVKIDLGALTGLNQAALSQSPNAFADPTQALNELRGVSRDVEDLGTESVRGVSTHHYRVDIDLKKAAASLPASARCTFQASTKMLGTSTLPAEVWIDSQGRLRQMRFSMQFPAVPGATSGGSMDMLLDLYDFGVPVHVKAPPASAVEDITQEAAGSQPPQLRACTGTTT
jgi:hypothetical protein